MSKCHEISHYAIKGMEKKESPHVCEMNALKCTPERGLKRNVRCLQLSVHSALWDYSWALRAS